MGWAEADLTLPLFTMSREEETAPASDPFVDLLGEPLG
jgi:hypothetical protein